ncbi:hypothetical protein FPQ18DRAFT_22510 [Pyronema domesticum]|uniref:Uncharacterized protein n=1 Tax=Pyronema omphalodes (strain CBS 100304) TaxID=1076935 RepID=U4KUT6_PYROM|nr:hypothetical protein FPQ18DRAFT_22510 [Pyronema domesticum]CCX05163.1 Protein of unknown function [Pyronema omphalodes CBS 100304]
MTYIEVRPVGEYEHWIVVIMRSIQIFCNIFTIGEHLQIGLRDYNKNVSLERDDVNYSITMQHMQEAKIVWTAFLILIILSFIIGLWNVGCLILFIRSGNRHIKWMLAHDLICSISLSIILGWLFNSKITTMNSDRIKEVVRTIHSDVMRTQGIVVLILLPILYTFMLLYTSVIFHQIHVIRKENRALSHPDYPNRYSQPPKYQLHVTEPSPTAEYTMGEYGLAHHESRTNTSNSGIWGPWGRIFEVHGNQNGSIQEVGSARSSGIWGRIFEVPGSGGNPRSSLQEAPA